MLSHQTGESVSWPSTTSGPVNVMLRNSNLLSSTVDPNEPCTRPLSDFSPDLTETQVHLLSTRDQRDACTGQMSNTNLRVADVVVTGPQDLQYKGPGAKPEMSSNFMSGLLPGSSCATVNPAVVTTGSIFSRLRFADTSICTPTIEMGYTPGRNMSNLVNMSNTTGLRTSTGFSFGMYNQNPSSGHMPGFLQDLRPFHIRYLGPVCPHVSNALSTTVPHALQNKKTVTW